ncbi:SUMF1/EgtB/PvdO family nonheme iron enzyme [Chloroflexi bacterium TSY]|nr:SUMF1/EgtB/PvdO family nonheme iron enzyme [Chloroflexi bacterium TSY]
MIKILFLAANPLDTNRLRLDEEMRAIDAAVRQEEQCDQIDIRSHWAVHIEDLQKLLLRHQPDIVHFSGLGKAADRSIILQSDTNIGQSVSASALSDLFSILHNNLRCVVLNACYSESQAQVISQHVDCVVGMNDTISDEAARNFGAALYGALAYGRSMFTAFALACNRIDLVNLPEQDVPRLLAPNMDPKEIYLLDELETKMGQPSVFRDVIKGDKVGGDKVGKDKIAVGKIEGLAAIGNGVVEIGGNVYIGVPVPMLEATVEEEPTDGVQPYKGLHFFDVDDSVLFFGREQLTAKLIARLWDKRFLAVIGASGSGKSSVVRAGVVPALKRGLKLANGRHPPKSSPDWQYHIIKPTARPLKAVSASLTRGSESVTAQATLMDDMMQDARSLDLFASRLLADLAADHLLLVVDQFEELFTLCKTPTERKAFVDNLLMAAQPDGVMTVIIALRADFYHRCAEFDDLRTALTNSQEYMGAMIEQELRTAIEKPANANNWVFEAGLVDVMLDDVGDEPGALPLLSLALLETWKNRHGRTLTFSGYYKAGGVKGAIATQADMVFNALSPNEQAVARNIFVRLTELGEGSEDTRRRVAREELLSKNQDAETVNKVLTTLSDARLITVDQGEVEVAHEALIREWPTLRLWLEDDREGLRIHRRLTEAATEWHRSGRKQGDLSRGTRLNQALDWARTHGNDMNSLEQAFLDASREQIEAEQREFEQARQREIDDARKLAEESEARRKVEAARAQEAERNTQEQMLLTRRLGRYASYLAVALVLAIAAVITTGIFFVDANEQRKLAVQNANSARANEKRANDQGALAKKMADEAEDQRNLAEGRINQLGLSLGIFGIERLLQTASELDAAGDSDGATTMLAIAIESNISLLDESYMDELNVTEQKILGSALIEAGLQLWGIGNKSAAEIILAKTMEINLYAPSYVLIPPGEFTMGSSHEDGLASRDEMPSRSVFLDEFEIMRTEVTNAQFAYCVVAGVCTAPKNETWNQPRFANHPVKNVSWIQATAYAEWVGGRLPTEAEWEKACRGQDGQIYPWGDEPPTDQLANFNLSVGNTTDVGQYPEGMSPYGLSDMSGNVWEWTSDWYVEFSSREQNLDGLESGTYRTLRGGSWFDDARYVRCARRDMNSPLIGTEFDGFRVVRRATDEDN